MNIVCLTGRLVRRGGPTDAGWYPAVLEVARRRPGGSPRPGVIYVSLVISRGPLAASAQPGQTVAVVGLLDIEPGSPASEAPTVIVESIEPVR
jgi:hypothetical protein